MKIEIPTKEEWTAFFEYKAQIRERLGKYEQEAMASGED